MRFAARSSAAIAAAVLLASATAAAQPAEVTANREAARALAETGFERFNAGKYDESLEHFQRAEERFHAPVHLLFIGRSLAKLGRLVQARTTFQSIVEEKLANYAPDAFRDAQAEARVELDAIKKRIPTLAVAITGAAPADVTVTVDGKSVADPTAIALDPGNHTVVGTPREGTPVSKSVTLEEGQAARATLSFEAPRAAPPPPEAPPPPSSGRSNAPAIAAFAVGGAGLAVGAVTGILSLSKVSSVKEHCNAQNVCDPAFEGDASSAKTLGTVSTIGFVVGGVAAAAGVVLVVLAPRSPEPVAIRATPGGVIVAGRFGGSRIR